MTSALVKELTGLKRRVRILETAPRLAAASLEGQPLPSFDNDGNLRAIIGPQPDGSHTIVVKDGPTPLQPTDPGCEGHSYSIAVTWDGNLIGPFGEVDADLPLYSDFEVCEVHVAPLENAFPTQLTLAGEMGRQGGTLNVPSDMGEVWVRLRIRSQAGIVGPPSPAVRVDVAGLVDPGIFDQLERDLIDLALEVDASGAELASRLHEARLDLDSARVDLDAARVALAAVRDVSLPALAVDLDAAKDKLDSAFPTGVFPVATQITQTASATATAAALDAQTKANTAAAAAEQAAKDFAAGKATEAEAAAKLAAAADAKTKADAARDAAIAAAATDATGKASAAQQAALTGAQNYANTARQAAIDAAATDAQAKANAAAAAAEQAAKDYAEAQASGAGADALAAAKTHADQKAAAAQSAAETYAAAQRDAAIAAAATDATTKAATARQAAITAAAADALTKANTAAAAAEQAAKDYALAQASGASADALAAAKTHADAAAAAAQTAATNAAETKANAAKNAAIDAAALTAQTKADVARQAAIDAAAADATAKANVAQAAADAAATAASTANSAAQAAAGLAGTKGETIVQTSAPTGTKAVAQNLWIRLPDNVPHRWNPAASGTNKWQPITDKAATDAAAAAAAAQARAEAVKTEAINAAAADAASKASAAQSAAITQAGVLAGNAKSEAITAAATDATTKANNAKTAAETAAKTHADAQAEAARLAAISAAAGDATSKANAAKAQAIADAAADALTKANAARDAAVAAAATDATTKANNARTSAITAAATDATTKANAARDAAVATANVALQNAVNLIDNPSRTGVVGRWRSASPTIETLTVETVDADGRPARALRITSTGSGQTYSSNTSADHFDVDPTKAYLISFDAWDEKIISGTQFYFGITTYDTAGSTVAASAGVTSVSVATGAPVTAPSANFYFISTATPPVGQWRRYVGYLMPHGTDPAAMKGLGVNVNSNAILAPGTAKARVRILNYANTAGNPRYLDILNPSVVEVDPQSVLTANAAQGAAAAAGAAAGAAQGTADTALTTANAAVISADGKNTNTYSDVTTNPGPTPTVAFGAGRRQFDTHRNRLSTTVVVDGVPLPPGTVTAEWMWTGSSWAPVHLGDAMLRSLDVGRLTAGSAAISDAVIQKLTVQVATIIELTAGQITAGQLDAARINVTALAASMADIIEARIDKLTVGTGTIRDLVVEKLWAEVVRSRKITTDMLLVGSGTNNVVDPYLLNSDLNIARAAVSTGPWVVAKDGAEAVFEVTQGATQTLRFISSNGGTAERVDPVTPGDVYRIRYDYRRVGTSTAGRIRPAVRWVTTAGIAATAYPRSTTIALGTAWATDEVEWTAPGDAAGAYLEVVSTLGASTTKTQIRRPSIVSKTDASLVVDGAIKARHIVAEEIAAALGQFVKVKAENIEAGVINAAVRLGAAGRIVAGTDVSGISLISNAATLNGAEIQFNHTTNPSPASVRLETTPGWGNALVLHSPTTGTDPYNESKLSLTANGYSKMEGKSVWLETQNGTIAVYTEQGRIDIESHAARNTTSGNVTIQTADLHIKGANRGGDDGLHMKVTGRVSVNGDEMTGAWTTFTPTLWATTTNPTMGNTQRLGRYKRIGNTVFVNIRFLIGSTFGIGSGAYMISIPVPALAAAGTQLLNANIVAVGGGDVAGVAKIEGGEDTGRIMRIQLTNQPRATMWSSSLTHGFPITTGLAGGSIIQIGGSYECA